MEAVYDDFIYIGNYDILETKKYNYLYANTLVKLLGQNIPEEYANDIAANFCNYKLKGVLYTEEIMNKFKSLGISV
jgi:hypothetical protein